ncbi:MAG: DNA mismatch repair protein MutL [Fimbriimonadales bacterium]|nr:MAG: DNA mismatch repair protein MutL [Fimbriimonadales bacterium]
MRTRPARRPIQALDEQLVNRIAAGEVVERPAAALKELIENALDAGAARIEIEAAMGGRNLIRVRDDGIGMTREDALNALQRHATSKIASDADLNRISTLGFRGEALPSIASVSRMEILTRAFEEDTGTQIVIEGGEVKSVEEIGAPIGTTITVRDLFYNVPARLKFLKTVPTELGHLVETVTRYAFAYPDVSFRLVHERQELIFTPGNGDLLTAVAALWGREMVQGMVEVDYERDGMRVWGLIAPPHQTRPTRQHQYFYVNLRPVRNKTLIAALDEAYKSLTPEKRYPACVLLVDVDPRTVDVNVHPAKIEVRFQREQAVFEAVVNAIRAALLQHGMIPSALPQGASRRSVITPVPMPDTETIHQILMQRAGLSSTGSPAQAEEESGTIASSPSEEASSPTLHSVCVTSTADSAGTTASSPSEEASLPPLRSVGGASAHHPSEALPTTNDSMDAVAPSLLGAEPLATTHLPFAHLLEDLQILGQVQNTYIIASTKQGLVLIDQHVAHERVLYEQLCRDRGALPIPKQHLLTPETLQLSRRDTLLLQEKLPELQAIGFELEPFGQDAFLVRAAPAALKGDPVQTLRDIIDELVELSVSKRLPVAREQIWITTSCKMAVKAGDTLSLPEMRKLIEDLARTENPYLCPHGRPITLTLSWGDIERRFKRS